MTNNEHLSFPKQKPNIDNNMRAAIEDEKLRALCLELNRVIRKAESIGIFTGCRDLLNCTHCGLQEDVLFDGKLVTYQTDASSTADSGLRFIAADGDSFLCPQCGFALTATE